MTLLPFILLHHIFTGRNLRGLIQRFGFFGKNVAGLRQTQRIWFHAASVGEVQAAKALINEVEKRDIRADLIISTMTEQGYLVASSQLGSKALCIYAPIDLPWIADRFIQTLRPSLYVCLETELWPNILNRLNKCGIQALLLNGRMTERSFQRYRKVHGFMGQILQCFSQISTIQPSDAEKYIALGAQPQKVMVNGNAKYDLPLARAQDSLYRTAPDAAPGNNKSQSDLLPGVSPEQPLLVAGSTHTGEEEMLAAAYQLVKQQIPGIVFVIAPRHLQRLEAIEQLLTSLDLRHQRLSQLSGELPKKLDIILVDCMGELIRLYQLATYVFCGGSLIDRGGHNIMEAAACGKTPIYGPYMSDFQDARTMLEAQDAGCPVSSVTELAEKILFFANHPDRLKEYGERALAVATAQAGAATLQTQIIINNLH